MQATTGAILLVIGVVALFAAIVGGGVKIREIEVGNLPSRWRQGLLAVFGIVVGITGLIMVMNPLGSESVAAAPQNAQSSDQTNDGNGSETANDSEAVGQNATDAQAADGNGTDSAADNSSGEPTPQ